MKKNSILIIDNELFILKKAQSILAPENLTVKIASTMNEAYEHFSSGEIDLIIFSRSTIGVKVEEFLKNIRSYQHLKYIPVIVMLAEDDKKDAVDLLKIGIRDYILKPFKSKELIFRVLTALNLKKELSPTSTNILYKSNLDDMSLIEIIKICEIHNFSGMIKIKEKNKEYYIELRLGNITAINASGFSKNEVWDKILSLSQSSLEIEQEPPSFWRAKKENLKLLEEYSPKKASVQSNAKSDSSQIAKKTERLPMGRISSLKIDNRQFQIQTEVHPGAHPIITTLIICEGQILKKIERKWMSLTDQEDKITKEQDKINEHHDTIVSSLYKLWPLAYKPHDLAADILLKTVRLIANFARRAVGRNICLYYLKDSHASLIKKFPELSVFSIDEDGKISLASFDSSKEKNMKSGLYQWLSKFSEKCYSLSPLFKTKELRELTRPLEFQLEWIDFYPGGKNS